MKTIFAGIDGTTQSWTKNEYFAPFDLAMSFVKAIHDGSTAAAKKHYPGPDIWGNGTPICVRETLEFITMQLGLPRTGDAPAGWRPPDSYQITLAGYSRGAYAALRVAQGLGKLGLSVHYLCLIDTVKVSTAGQEAEIAHAFDRYDSSFSIAADAVQLRYLPPEAGTPEEVAAGLQGRRLLREAYVPDRQDKGRGAGNLVDAAGHFVIPRNVKRAIHAQRSATAKSRMVTMGTAPVEFPGGDFLVRRDFRCTHSALGGMPFRGDHEHNLDLSPESEWAASREVASMLSTDLSKYGAIKRFVHPVIQSVAPPSWWLGDSKIKGSIAARDKALAKVRAKQERERLEMERLTNPRRAVMPWEKL